MSKRVKALYIAHSPHSSPTGTSSAYFTEPAMFLHAIVHHLCLHWDAHPDEIAITGISVLPTARKRLCGNTTLRVAYATQYIGELEGDVDITTLYIPTPAYVGYVDLLDGGKPKSVHNNLIYERQLKAVAKANAGELP